VRSRIHHAAEWLVDREVRRPGDWAKKLRNAPPAGWYFEYRNEFYPDVDDTIMVMMALREAVIAQDTSASDGSTNGQTRRTSSTDPLVSRAMAACQRGMRWVLAMQNRDGGWGAFDRDNDHEFLTRVPFADHNAMIDPSTPDITARVLEMLGGFGDARGDRAILRAIDRGLALVRRTQEPDGAWPGRWGVNYIYGTWQVLVGMAAVGVPGNDAAMVRGAEWLLRHQQPCGGWGESPDSYADPSLRGQGNPTPSQTAWALLGLHAAGRTDDPAFARGVSWLLDQQRPEGDWHEPEFTGTGFPLVFYLRYDLYRLYFPVMALACAAFAKVSPRTGTVWKLDFESCL
jgi:squalene-hopene/tetraprenyl-beta-curcumene cyclase